LKTEKRQSRRGQGDEKEEVKYSKGNETRRKKCGNDKRKWRWRRRRRRRRRRAAMTKRKG
jgi:hypothetical protein